MRRKKRTIFRPLSIAVSPQLHRELSELCWALDRSVSDIAREMMTNDLPRFKDRHRTAIRDGRKSDESQEATDSVD